MRGRVLSWGLPTVVVVLAALVPFFFTVFFTSSVALTTLWLGLAAASLTFLSGQGGMVSLAQTALFGVAGLTAAKLGADLGWNPWLAGLAGIVAAGVIGLVFGAIASGSQGIYFLVISLAFAQITYYYFAAVGTFGAHQGINGIRPPEVLGDPVLAPAPMYWFTLLVCVIGYAFLRYLTRTPFGLALQGVRDDPLRMTALGYRVRLHRLLGFAIAAPVAGAAGVLSAWSNSRISADSITLGIAIVLLTVAVIGGLSQIGAAWLGALVYTVLDTYMRGFTGRFATWIGLVFLVIVLLSPGGLGGLASSLVDRVRTAGRRPTVSPVEPLTAEKVPS